MSVGLPDARGYSTNDALLPCFERPAAGFVVMLQASQRKAQRVRLRMQEKLTWQVSQRAEGAGAAMALLPVMRAVMIQELGDSSQHKF